METKHNEFCFPCGKVVQRPALSPPQPPLHPPHLGADYIKTTILWRHQRATFIPDNGTAHDLQGTGVFTANGRQFPLFLAKV